MTIYALSTGPGVSGIAVVRISGKETSRVIKLLTKNDLPKPRVATLRKITKINKKLDWRHIVSESMKQKNQQNQEKTFVN